MPLFQSLSIDLPDLIPKEAMLDALHRCLEGIDKQNASLFKSAFVDEAKWNIDGKVSDGLDAIMVDCYERVAPLLTTHHVTNVRVDTQGQLTATVVANHFKEKGGPGFIAGSFYYLECVPADHVWKIKNWKMKVNWYQGDYSIVA